MRVFLSSSVKGYEDRRILLQDAIAARHHTPILSEHQPFDVHAGVHSHDGCLRQVASSDLYVLVVQEDYGQEYQGVESRYNGLSVTHAEYREAIRRKKPIVVAVDASIPEQRDKHLRDPQDPTVTLSPELFDFYAEVAADQKWIDFFRDTAHLRDVISNRLARPLGSQPKGVALKRARFSFPAPNLLPGTIDVLSTWTCKCDSLLSVTKIWRIQGHNGSDSALRLEQPLLYPIPYPDARLASYRAQLVKGDERTGVSGFGASIGHLGSPVHDTTLTLTLGGVIVEPGESLDLSVEFRHSAYFVEVAGDTWVHTGSLSFLDYPGFRGRSVVQRVWKEFWFAPDALVAGARNMTVAANPRWDWELERSGTYMLGYGRYFDIDDKLRISMLIH